MADELDLDRIETEVDQQNRVEKRIKDLSEKVRLTSEERDERDKLLQERDSEIASLKTERDFLSSFGDQTQKFPDAVSFRDEIKEKVLKGYSVEDATVSVLNEKGKLMKEKEPEQEQQEPAPEKTIEKAPAPKPMPAGGSAPTPPPQTGSKELKDLSREEKREKLLEAEQRGDIGIN